jgi:hypothetical protein
LSRTDHVALGSGIGTSRGRLEAEVIVLRHQLNILRRQSPRRVRLNAFDRAIFVYLYRHFPDIGKAVAIIRPETVIRWHRVGLRAWWRLKSRNPGGRPKIDPELRDLVRRMGEENPLWGAPRIHGELLKLGFTVAQSTVSKYMLRGRRPPSQGWKTFLRNHTDGIAALLGLPSFSPSVGYPSLSRIPLSPGGSINALRLHLVNDDICRNGLCCRARPQVAWPRND